MMAEEKLPHSLPLLHLGLEPPPPPPHKTAIAMEYLTQVTTVPITQTTDASKKRVLVQQHSNSSNLLLLVELGTKQDREIERGEYTVINNNTRCLIGNKISTLLTISAAAIALLLTSSLLFSQALQPVQAQTPMTFRTPEGYPAGDEIGGVIVSLTFDAQGTLTPNSPGHQTMNGTYQITSTSDGSILNSGNITSGKFFNNSDGASITLVGTKADITAPCSTSETNNIQVGTYTFIGPVECFSSEGGGDTTAQPSSSSPSMTGATTTTQQDSDRDGIPDSSDRCTHNSNPRCFKEGDTSNTTTQQEQPPSNRTGNQTR